MKDSPSPFPLPQELVDCVIDQLFSDFRTLKVVGLVNSQWYPHTRDYLFRKITFGARSSGLRAAQLLDLLKKKPTLSRSVLDVNFTDDVKHPGHPGWMEVSASKPNVTNMIKLLPLLTRTTHVYLKGCPRLGLNWTYVSADLRFAFVKLMSQSTVRKIILESIDNLDVSIFSKIKHVEEVEFFGLQVAGQNRPRPRQTLGQPPPPTYKDHRLDLFDVTMSGEIWKDLIAFAKSSRDARHILYPRSLRINSLGWNDTMALAWKDFLSVSAAHITTLVLTLEALDPVYDKDNETYPSALFNFLPFTQLRMILLQAHPQYFYKDECSPLPAFLDALDEYGAQPGKAAAALQIVSINFDLTGRPDPFTPPYNPVPAMRKIASSNIWQRLATIVERPGFTGLSPGVGWVMVNFDFDARRVAPSEWTRTKEAIERALRPIQRIVDVMG